MNNAVLSGKAACYKDQGEGREEVMSVFEEMKEEGFREGFEEGRREALEKMRREMREEAHKQLVGQIWRGYGLIQIPIETIARIFGITVDRTKELLLEDGHPVP